MLLLSFPCLTRESLFTVEDYPVKLDNDRENWNKSDNDKRLVIKTKKAARLDSQCFNNYKMLFFKPYSFVYSSQSRSKINLYSVPIVML